MPRTADMPGAASARALLAPTGMACDSVGVREYRTPVLMQEAVETARAMLAEGAPDRVLWRHAVLQLLDDYESARRRGVDAAGLMAARPEMTGDSRVDAALAALVEHLAERDGWTVPAWVDEPGRHAGDWLVSGLASFRSVAEQETPRAFRKHGVLITAGALARA